MNAFDPQQFAQLLKKLVGKRKAQSFAEEAGISKYQLSRRLAGSLNTPPSISMLKAFASHAQNDVTFEDLLTCCGYEVSKFIDHLAAPIDGSKTARTILLSDINDFHLPVTLLENAPASACDFALTLGSDPLLTWCFKYLPSDEAPALLEQTLNNSFLELLYKRLTAYSKFSFLTSSSSVYSACGEKRPVNLNANVSVILYSAETLEILSEKPLSSSVADPVPETLCFKESQ